MARTLMLALAACIAVAAAAAVASAQPPGSILLSAYSEASGQLSGQLWSMDPTNGVTTLMSRDALFDPVAAPADRDTLRRDSGLVIDSMDGVLTFRQLSSSKSSAPQFTGFYSYLRATHASGMLYPIPLAVACSFHDPILNTVVALSSARMPNGAYNITLSTQEYNGDFYSRYQTFFTMALDDPSSGAGVSLGEDPTRPACAYDETRSMISFHFPAAPGSKAQGGMLYTIAIAMVNWAPQGKLVGSIAWPPAAAAVTQLSAHPSQPGVLQSLSARQSGGSTLCIASVVDPLTGQERVVTEPQPQLCQLVAPRSRTLHPVAAPGSTNATDARLLLVEWVQPWRYAIFSFEQQSVVTQGQLQFDPQAGLANQRIITVHQTRMRP